MTRRSIISGITFPKYCFRRKYANSKRIFPFVLTLATSFERMLGILFHFRWCVIKHRDQTQVQTLRSKLTVGKRNVLLLFKYNVYPRVKLKTKDCQRNHKQKSKCPFINTRGVGCDSAHTASVRKFFQSSPK